MRPQLVGAGEVELDAAEFRQAVVLVNGATAALGISWFGVSWNRDSRERQRAFFAGCAAALLALFLISAGMPAGAGITQAAGRSVSVIVRTLPEAGAGTERAIQRLGGSVGRRLGIINGFEATVPESELGRLQATPGVQAVTPNAQVTLQSTYDTATDPGSMSNTAADTGAGTFWAKGFTGKGVDVALIDSGVVPVPGLSAPGKVLNGADLSDEAGVPQARFLDTFGHGTHMAGIIAGKDNTVSVPTAAQGPPNFTGMAPDARIVNVKVAGYSGAVNVSQVIVGVAWVIMHAHDNGLNIRVLNLSFGSTPGQAYALDPLAFAAEVAWQSGIVVVASAGNAASTSGMADPAYDPYVLSVGADDTRGTPGVADDTIPAWSDHGDGVRNPDLVAPGKSVVSLRDPGSFVDLTYPTGLVDDGTHRFFRGSGTSQAAAVTSGAVALLLQQRPSLTPDQVKALLTSTADPLPSVARKAQGSGLLDLAGAFAAPTPTSVQTWPRAQLAALNGGSPSGSWSDGGSPSGSRSDGGSPSGGSWSGGSWSGGSWSGGSWSGGSWSGGSWSGGSWSGGSWSGGSWSGGSWSGGSWSGGSWSGGSWSGGSWSGGSWSADTWAAKSWS